MGEIFSWKGKRADYHLELGRHSEKRLLPNELGKRKISAVLYELVPTEKSKFEGLLTALNHPKPEFALLMEEAAKHGTDIWFGDYRPPELEKELGKLVLGDALARGAAGGAALASGGYAAVKAVKAAKKKELSRRDFLKMLGGAAGAVAFGSAAGTPVFEREPAIREGRPSAPLIGRISRKIIAKVVVQKRDEIAAAKLGFMADHYSRKTGTRPGIAAIYGFGHAEIGQLVENEEATKRLLEEVKENPEMGRMWKLHFNPGTKKWESEEHNLLDMLKPKPLK